jgi:hypothetical protein
MTDQVLRNLQVLQKADLIIARIWINDVVRRGGLLTFAGLIAVFGLAMANVAGLHALQAIVGMVWAASIMAVVDLGLAAIVLLVTRSSGPGPEIELAFEARKIALEMVQADARDLKVAIDAIGEEVKTARANITQLVHNPMDVAAQKLLVPAALSMLRGLRSKKD